MKQAPAAGATARWFRPDRRAVALLAVAGWMLLAWPRAQAQRPAAVVPASSAEVVERLPRGYAELVPDVAAKGDPAPDLHRIRALLESSARTGDTRLAARARALLGRLPAAQRRTPAALQLLAFGEQHRHAFPGALRLLDQAVRADPRDGAARLSRAQVLMVQGRLRDARADCQALALGVDVDSGLLCAASLALRNGDEAMAARLLDVQLARMPGDDPRRGFALLARAEAASRAGAADAGQWYRKARKHSPGDVRVLVSNARHLRRAARPGEVEALLAGAVQSDSAQLQRTLAATEAGSPRAGDLAAAQARRYALAHAVGVQPELRDEADFLLLQERPREALALARRNFEQQRDYEDVDILLRAARAAGAPDALEPLRRWAEAEGVRLADGAREAM